MRYYLITITRCGDPPQEVWIPDTGDDPNIEANVCKVAALYLAPGVTVGIEWSRPETVFMQELPGLNLGDRSRLVTRTFVSEYD